MTSREKTNACGQSFYSSPILLSICLLSGCCEPRTELHSMRYTCMALLKPHAFVFVFCTLSSPDELSYNAYRCEYRACPRLACGRCGGARRGQGTHEQQGMAASLFPPQNIKAAIDRASTFCLCERKKHWPVFRWPLLFSRPSCNKRDRHGRQCEK